MILADFTIRALRIAKCVLKEYNSSIQNTKQVLVKLLLHNIQKYFNYYDSFNMSFKRHIETLT